MSLAPRPSPRDSGLRGTGGPPNAAFNILLSIVLAGGLMVMLILLHYRFDQAQHRLIKILLGFAAASGIMLKPFFGLFLFPIMSPFLTMLPKLPIPGFNTLNAFLTMVFGSWLVASVMSRQAIGRPMRLALPIGLFVLALVVSWIRGAAFPTGYRYDVASTGLAMFRMCVGFVPYFIGLLMVKGQGTRRALVWAIVLGLLAEGVMVATGFNASRTGRARGSIGQENDLGAFLATYTVFAMAILPSLGGFGKVVLTAAVALGSYGVLLSVSRGAMVALALGLLVVNLRSSRVLTVLSLITLLTSPIWVPEQVRERVLSTMVEGEAAEDAELEASAMQRVDTWRAIGKLVSDHPIDGVGFGGLEFVLEDAGEKMGLGKVKDSAHNTFLRLLAELGFPGLMLFFFLLWRIFWVSENGVRLATNRFDRQIAVGLSSALMTLLITCMFGDRFFRLESVGGIWIACCLVEDFSQERAAESKSREAPSSVVSTSRRGSYPFGSPSSSGTAGGS